MGVARYARTRVSGTGASVCGLFGRVRLLFDENLSRCLISLCAVDRPGSSPIGLLGMRGAADTEIWTFARREDFMIVGKDDDFRNLALSMDRRQRWSGFSPAMPRPGASPGYSRRAFRNWKPLQVTRRNSAVQVRADGSTGRSVAGPIPAGRVDGRPHLRILISCPLYSQHEAAATIEVDAAGAAVGATDRAFEYVLIPFGGRACGIGTRNLDHIAKLRQ